VAAAVSLLLVLGALSALFLWGVRSVVKATSQSTFDWKLARRIIAAVAVGELKADAYGRVLLPTRYASSSFANRVYVTRKGKGRSLILFPTSEGWDGYVDGYLYSSQPLVPAGLVGRGTTSGHETVTLSYGKLQPRIAAELLRQVSAQWYFVHHDEFTRQ
jgi:hypothetical protein